MVEDRQHGARHEARAARALRGGGEEDDRIRAVAAVGMEVVLDRPHGGVAEVVAEPDQVERVAPVALGAPLRRADVGEELDAELHASLLEVPTQMRVRSSVEGAKSSST